MRQLKFCLVTCFYPPYSFGGDGIFTQRLARLLVQEGHEVHVIHDHDAYTFCGGKIPKRPKIDDEGINVYSIGTGNVDKVDMVLRHQLGRPVRKSEELRELLDQDFDVIHFHNISLMGGPEILTYGSGIKLCTLHDHWFVCAMHVLWKYNREACTKRECLKCTTVGGRPPQLWRYTDAVSEAARHVGAFIAPSQFAKRSHISNGFPAPIKVLSHFMPASEINTSVASESRPPYFLYVGRLEKLKGVQFLIEHFKSFKKAQLVIAGTGNYEKELISMASGYRHIEFLGKVSSSRLQALYKGAIAVLVPSLCFETFGLVPLEAFAHATPAVVHNLGALPEVVQKGGGLTYTDDEEFLNALNKLSSDMVFRDHLGREGRANLLANYTEKRHLDGYYAMIEDLDFS